MTGQATASHKRPSIERRAALRARATVIALFGLPLLAACAPSFERNGIADPALAEQASIKQIPGIRFWGDEVPADPLAEIRRRTPSLPPIAKNARRSGGRPIVETLALSGGGADGAFGAGLLAGWTARGDRPEFEVVTGVSAGAIIAPFAFLGPEHDEDLRHIWTEYQASEVVTTQILPGLFGGQSLADTAPLRKLVAQYVDHDLLRAVAAQYKRGRILMVLTTNLDAQRPVVWNMGEIALVGTDQALDLFRSVILASAAIPGAFPPVNIPVEVNGKMYEEMHVDGGTTREVFVLPVQAPFRAFDALYPAPPIRKIYIVKNGRLTPEPTVVQQTTLTIASRAIATLVKSQNWSEMYRIYRLAHDDGADFNIAAIPPSFTATTTEIYDPKYQKALYEAGMDQGRSNVWMKSPPGQTPISSVVATKPKSKRAPPTPAPVAAPTAVPSVEAPAPIAPDAAAPGPSASSPPDTPALRPLPEDAPLTPRPPQPVAAG